MAIVFRNGQNATASTTTSVTLSNYDGTQAIRVGSVLVVSVQLYEQGGNKTASDKEKAELYIIEKYLPDMMSEQDVLEVVESAIKETDANSMQEMGKVMGLVNKQLAGQADGSMVAKIVKDKLQ